MVPGRFVEPLGLITGPVAFHALREGFALPLQGGDIAFAFVRLIEDGEDLGVGPVREVPEDWQEQMQTLAQRPAPFAGLPTDRPLVMGIVNVTPDSFSDAGRHFDPHAAIAAGHAMLEAGADIIDVGGESTRPGSATVTAEDEAARILPVVRELAKAAPVSVDTRNAATMRAALDAGAEIVNDISAMRHDAAALDVVARSEAPVILMHMPGDDPATMQSLATYDDVVVQVAGFLRDRVAACEAAGIPRGRIAVDPGIGFGKTLAHNLALIDRLPLLMALGCRVVLGVSRKRFIGTLSGVEQAGQRVPGSVAGALAGAARGASVLRVHDVAETVQALAVWRACAAGRPPE
ncbi:dihydropteroate synthase [Neoroseomonas soli]|uniref:Dihydropteroate synthase n=1 Tax=Neoroseomonas soli TaxID=1081025 RepID=A0A9X9X1W6_9PROT|nr:dihydropteroate synthase [Neoroseomonas soli]MBR0673395.1 dihydropteroate synthase [Neoroseomonas soli]